MRTGDGNLSHWHPFGCCHGDDLGANSCPVPASPAWSLLWTDCRCRTGNRGRSRFDRSSANALPETPGCAERFTSTWHKPPARVDAQFLIPPSTRQQTAEPHLEGGQGTVGRAGIIVPRGRASETGVSSCGRTAIPQANQTLCLGNDRSAVRVRAISRGDRFCPCTAGVAGCGTDVRRSANDVFESGETDDIPT